MAILAIRPMLSSLRQHKLTACLMLLQVAVTYAIVCNVGFMIAHRYGLISMDSGVDEAGLSMLGSQIIDKHENMQARQATDLLALRHIPGVTAAVAVDTLPLGRSETSVWACASDAMFEKAIAADSVDVPGCMQPAVLNGTPGELKTLGLHLMEGRDFHADEFVAGHAVPVAILSKALAEKMYPGQDALGQTVITGERKPIRVIGIVDTLVRPKLNGLGTNQLSMLWPLLPEDASVTYLLRSAPRDRQRVLQAAMDALMQIDPQRIIDPDSVRTYTEMRQSYFHRDSSMIGLLAASGLGLLFVTALGITGLANFWVQQRTRSIGIRRALGATRGDILGYFQVENLLVVLPGVLLGLLLAELLSVWLLQRYATPLLPAGYALGAAVLMIGLGQLAVLNPALRAAAVAPVVATRAT